MPARLPQGTQPDDVVKASFYYGIEAEEAQRRRNPPLSNHDGNKLCLRFPGDLGLQQYTLWQMRP
jgi:hypothetical protein